MESHHMEFKQSQLKIPLLVSVHDRWEDAT